MVGPHEKARSERSLQQGRLQQSQMFKNQVSIDNQCPLFLTWPTLKSLASFPLEIRRIIAKEFVDDPVSSICLGITCKSFMWLYKEFIPCPIGLKSITLNTKRCPRWLTYLLKD